MGQPINVLIVDDHPRVREALRANLSSTPELNVVGIAENAKEVLKLARSTRPDVVLLDLRLPLYEVVKTTVGIVALAQGSRVVWYSFDDDEDRVLRMMAAGASGFVSKQGPSAEVVEAIREVGAGRHYFKREVWRTMVQETRLGSVMR